MLGKVKVGVSLTDTGSYNRLDIMVINESDRAVDLQPESISLTQTSPKNMELKQQSEKDLQRSVNRRQAGVVC